MEGAFQLRRILQQKASAPAHFVYLFCSRGIPSININCTSEFCPHCPDAYRFIRSFGSTAPLSLYSRNYSCKHYKVSSLTQRNESESSHQSSILRRRSVVLGLPTVLLVFIGAALLVKSNDERRAVSKASKPTSIKVSRPAIGGPFVLTDYDKNLVASTDFIGDWTIIYFGYTFSPDAGPSELLKLARVIDSLETKNVRINAVFITVDPLRDSPSHLRAYLQEFHDKIRGLTGPVDAVRQVAQKYRVFFKQVNEEGSDYLIETSQNMYLLNPKMEFVRVFGQEYSASQLTYEIENEVKKFSEISV